MNRSKILLWLPLLMSSVTAPAFLQAQAPAAAAAKPVVVHRDVAPAEFERLLQGTNIVVLDVRTPAEFEDGHLPNALLLDFRSPEFTNKLAGLDPSKTYLVHCAAGVRSSRACVKMISLGFSNVVNLEGGLGAWTKAGKPIQK